MTDPLQPRDYRALFEYFIGAKGNHAVHIRALIHAGFIVDASDHKPEKISIVKCPTTMEVLGSIVGDPESVIGRYGTKLKHIRIVSDKGY